jgi:hypothetical protein
MITREIRRKKKAVESQQRYRQRLKEGTNRYSKLIYDNYSPDRAEYIRLYKEKRGKETKDAFKIHDSFKLRVNRAGKQE